MKWIKEFYGFLTLKKKKMKLHKVGILVSPLINQINRTLFYKFIRELLLIQNALLILFFIL